MWAQPPQHRGQREQAAVVQVSCLQAVIQAVTAVIFTIREYAGLLGLDIAGEKLDCGDMAAFSPGGAANPALYWSREGGTCALVTWQTAHSALVEGNYQRCLATTP